MGRSVIAAGIAIAGLGLAACGSAAHTTASAPARAASASQPASASSPSLMSTALALAAKAGCPNPADIATNGAAGAFPGAPEVGFTCSTTDGVFVNVFGSHADEQANLARTSRRTSAAR
jgi:hypothetical protein